MEKLRKMSRKAVLAAALILTQLVVFPLSVCAAVTATPEDFGKNGSVYVAGNPDCYPIEYYDAKKECYCGVMPELLKEISKAYDVDFVYVGAGSKDKRKQLAENSQVELVSCYTAEKDLPVKKGNSLFSVTLDGQTFDVAFGYTEIAGEELRTMIETYTAGISGKELAGRVAAFTAENRRNSGPTWVWVVVCGIGVVSLTAALWIALRMRKKSRENEIKQYIDPGINVWNRQYFLRQFSRTVSENICVLYYLSYLRFDISRVNEYYGEEEAEEMLRCAADVLGKNTTSSGFFARISGGGFAVLEQHISQKMAEKWISGIIRELNHRSIKFGHDYTPEFHAGIYRLKPGVTCETALYAASQGCVYAEQKKAPYVFCDEKLLRSGQQTERLRHEVIRAVENREFQCHMQFIASADTEKIYGAELLSRWYHPDLGLLAPGKYIPDMEEIGTISQLDFYMLEEACRILVRLQEEGLKEFYLFCNVSRKTVSLEDFQQRFKDITQKYSFEHRLLYLEITESCMFESEELVRENINYCTQEGFCVALDDVGSGHSSFSDLINYPVDVVKIDRSLLYRAEQKKDYRLLNGMNTLFHSICMKTLCEGAETAEQCRIIRDIGMDLIQGFSIQRALPVDEALRWLKTQE